MCRMSCQMNSLNIVLVDASSLYIELRVTTKRHTKLLVCLLHPLQIVAPSMVTAHDFDQLMASSCITVIARKHLSMFLFMSKYHCS